MESWDIVRAQLLDPFRWGLLVALVATMLRTEAATGRWLPLSAGAAFVAIVIPSTTGLSGGGDLARAVALGLPVNAAILGVILLAREGWLRLRP